MRISDWSSDVCSSDLVSSNDREVVAEAVGKLIDLGHRRIGFVRGPAGFRSAAEREKGFHEALAQAGLSLADENFAAGNYRFATGVEAGRKILSQPAPPNRKRTRLNSSP